jgi:hypothetical protein
MLGRPFAVAGQLLEWAAGLGFIGIAVYIACWIFMFPAMVGICVVLGAIGWGIEEESQKEQSKKIESLNLKENIDDYQNKESEEEDRNYENIPNGFKSDFEKKIEDKKKSLLLAQKQEDLERLERDDANGKAIDALERVVVEILQGGLSEVVRIKGIRRYKYIAPDEFAVEIGDFREDRRLVLVTLTASLSFNQLDSDESLTNNESGLQTSCRLTARLTDGGGNFGKVTQIKEDLPGFQEPLYTANMDSARDWFEENLAATIAVVQVYQGKNPI